ncbi:hypothetical protein ACA910_013187 [Epithemia clementina (nom. ined.)]
MSTNNPFHEGQVVKLHGLTSATGQRLNGTRALVVRDTLNTDGRLPVLPEAHEKNDVIALKVENVQALPYRNLPGPETEGYRGVHMKPITDDKTARQAAEAMCDLMVEVDREASYSPPETMLMGYGPGLFMALGQGNFGFFHSGQMENMSGVLGLAHMIREGDETKAALFAMLSSHPMVINVLIKMMTCVPYIGREEDFEKLEQRLQNQFEDSKTVTPDQTAPEYVKTMKVGPVSILDGLHRYDAAGNAFFAALRRSPHAGFLARRLLRWMAREALGTRDGKQFGPVARKVLPRLALFQPGVTTTTTTLRVVPSKEMAEQLLTASESVETMEQARTVLEQYQQES